MSVRRLMGRRFAGALIFACSAAVFSISGCGSAPAGGSQIIVSGAGSSFVFPILQEWASRYEKTHPQVLINYEPKGSGAGIAQFQAGTVDFAISDAPLTDKGLAKLGQPAIQFPLACGSVVVSYSIKGVGSGLRLTGPVLAKIFMGQITNWSDPAITSLNPGLRLPDEPIQVVHRSDSSGTTFIFASYLSAVSQQWQREVGADKSISFPIGVGGAQNAGVAGQIEQNEGSIGYLELAFAAQNNMPMAVMRNQAGQFVAASPDGASAAAASMEPGLAKDMRTKIVNAPGAKAYPICGFSFGLVSEQPPRGKDEATRALGDFLKYCVTDGQPVGKFLEYSPLPPAVVKMDLQLLRRLSP